MQSGYLCWRVRPLKINVSLLLVRKSGEEHFLSMRPELQHIQFWGVGGDEMQSKGIELLYHLKDFGSVGFSEVIGKLKFYKDAMNNIL